MHTQQAEPYRNQGARDAGFTRIVLSQARGNGLVPPCMFACISSSDTARFIPLHPTPHECIRLEAVQTFVFQISKRLTGRDDGPSTVPPYKPPRAACERGVRAGDWGGSPAFLVLRPYLPFFCFLCPGSLVYSALHTRPSAPDKAPTRPPATSPGRSPAALWYSPAEPTRACACGLVNLLVAVPLWTAAPPPLPRVHANAFAFFVALVPWARTRPRPVPTLRPLLGVSATDVVASAVCLPTRPHLWPGWPRGVPPPHANSRHPPPPALPHPRPP